MDDDTELDTELEDQGHERASGGESDREPTVREALESAWKEHGGELPDNEFKPFKRDDKSGQFKKDEAAKTAADGKNQDGAKDGEKVSTTATEQGTEGGSQDPAGGPPKGWSKEAQADWAKLPKHVQDAITKRETDMTKGAQQIRERYGFVHDLTTKLTPFCQKYQRTPAQAFEQLAAWWAGMERNPQDTLVALAKSYGITIPKPGASTQSPTGAQSSVTAQTDAKADPRLDSVMREIGSLKAAETNRQQTATNEMLKSWGSKKPHFAAVKVAMGQVIAGAAQTNDTTILDEGGRIDLDKVYDRAVWLVPEVRAAILKEQAAAEAKARQEQVDKARKAGASHKPGSPGNAARQNGQRKQPPKPGVSDVRQDIMAAIEEHRS